MNEIKESGLLERYILGEVSPNEQLQVEALLVKDSLLMSYFQQLEEDFERLAQENAVTPPTDIKKVLMKEITRETPSEIVDNKYSSKNSTGLKSYLAIAASLALLFGITSYWLYNQVNTLEDNLQIVQDQNNYLEETLEDVTVNFKDIDSWYQAINAPDAEKLVLKGNQLAPDATAISYINHKDKTVILNASGLPELPANKDYQLWADVDGEMIDMGVITKNSEMLAMTYIDKAKSLNITIEPAGGNDHPTVASLISNVYLD